MKKHSECVITVTGTKQDVFAELLRKVHGKWEADTLSKDFLSPFSVLHSGGPSTIIFVVFMFPGLGIFSM